MKKIQANKLGQYIASKVGKLSHLKLQKLIYYCEAWHLVFLNKSLINEEFEAWVHGPVVRSVWDEVKGYSNIYKPVSIKDNLKKEIIDKTESILEKEQLEVIEDVLSAYSRKTDYQLECLTHSEKPWQEARIGLTPDMKSSNIISKQTIKDYYEQKATVF